MWLKNINKGILSTYLCAFYIFADAYIFKGTLYHKTPCLNSGAFNVIAGLTQRECVCECFNQDRCSFLSYHRVMTARFLHRSVLYSTVVQSGVNECFHLNITEPEGIDYIESFNRNCSKSCLHILSDPHIDKCVNCLLVCMRLTST